jgi:hypothetical protein
MGNRRRMGKAERQRRRGQYADVFNDGFTMGYGMGYGQGAQDKEKEIAIKLDRVAKMLQQENERMEIENKKKMLGL